jgi:uncharacterized phage protein gp47/JayE
LIVAVTEDLLSLLPLFSTETEGAIRERFDAWANEGISVEDANEWVDTRPGSFFFLNTEPMVREVARAYDLMGTEFVGASFPLYSWGTYLDDLAAGYSVERLAATQAGGIVTFTGPEGTTIPAGTTLGVPAAVEDAGFKEYEVTEGGEIGPSGKLDLPVVSVEAGSVTNAAAGQVTEILSTIEAEEEVTAVNDDPIVGGTDPETDESLRERLLAVFEGRGPGNVRDYEIWARSYGGVGMVTVIPVWNGPGTVKVIVLTDEGQPVSAEVVEGLQDFLDPVAGKGSGQAPVGHTVTVATAEAIDVTVAAVIEFEEGYSLTGSGGETALEEAIIAAIQDYFASVQPGEEVVLQKISARIAAFDGVHDLKEVKLNGSAKNLLLDADPAQIASLDVEGSSLKEGEV